MKNSENKAKEIKETINYFNINVKYNIRLEKFYNYVMNDKFNELEEEPIHQEILNLLFKLDNVIEPNQIFYRARIIKDSDFKDKEKNGLMNNTLDGFNVTNSKETPSNKSEGRANSLSETCLYLASNEYTACCEVKPINQDFISIAEFEITSSLKVIDFSKIIESDIESNEELKYIQKKLHNQFIVPIKDVCEYKCTQYISNIIKKNGYDGIKYNSSFDNGYNLALFNYAIPKYINFKSSKIIECFKTQYMFFNLKEKNIVPYKKEIIELFNKDMTDKIKEIENIYSKKLNTNK